jgi:TolA-binding protein
VDTLANQFQAVREAIDESNRRLSRLDTQIADIKNLVSTMPAPSATAGPPATPQISAEVLFSNAVRDFNAGNYNLAGPQFNEYLKLYGETDRAAEAQYYLGEIFYQQGQSDPGQFVDAVAAYDQVIERYPEGRMTPLAHYKKGMALLRQGKREAARQEFLTVTKKYTRSDAAKQAAVELQRMGPPSGPTKSKKK